MKKIIATTLVLALGGLACGKEEGATTAPEATPATATPTTEAPEATTPDPATAGTDPAAGSDAGAAAAAGADVAPEAATASEVPTSEDFEEKAAKDVKKDNLEQEVQKMEKELGVKDAKKTK
jgi:hypothetical protein